MRINLGLGTLNLNEQTRSFDYMILPVGKFSDPRYQELDFSEPVLRIIESNFRAGIPAYQPPVNIEHNKQSGAYGYISDVKFAEGLNITVNLSEEGFNLVKEGKFKYMSAELKDYMDKVSGNYVGMTLVGVALTNQPANPYVPKIVLSEQEYSLDICLSELENMRGTKKTEEDKGMKTAEELQRELDAEKEKNRKLAQEKHLSDAEKQEQKWINGGVAPAIAAKAKDIILAEEREITLNDGSKKSLTDMVDALLLEIPKVNFKKVGKDLEKPVNLTEDEEGMKELNDILKEIEEERE